MDPHHCPNNGDRNFILLSSWASPKLRNPKPKPRSADACCKGSTESVNAVRRAWMRKLCETGVDNCSQLVVETLDF